MRVLYVPNEAGSFRQLGFRSPLANLTATGQISETSVFSLQCRILNGGDPEQHRQDLIERVRQFQPNLVLMQHLKLTGLRDRHFRQMRQVGTFELIYHEADPYSRFKHPLPLAAAAAGRSADVVFTVGTGTFRKNFLRAGATDVRWSPHVFEAERYGLDAISQEVRRPYDVVIVANRNSPRFRGHPNWRDRIKFVKLMQQRFGERLALYGRGWEGPGAKGPIDFSSQNTAIRSAWVSANWDHYASEPSYFSNRLPISLASGSIHATTKHPEYDKIFLSDTDDFLIMRESMSDLVDAIENYLSTTSPQERITAGIKAQKYAHSNYRQDDQVVDMLNAKSQWVDPVRARAERDLSISPLEEI